MSSLAVFMIIQSKPGVSVLYNYYSSSSTSTLGVFVPSASCYERALFFKSYCR